MRRTFWIAPTRWEPQAGEDKSVGEMSEMCGWCRESVC